jgi:hypothetical protein
LAKKLGFGKNRLLSGLTQPFTNLSKPLTNHGKAPALLLLGVFAMARISLDATFFSDPRIYKLSNKLNISRYEAEGRLLRLWHVCYEKRELEMSATYDPELITAMADCGLAKKNGRGLYRISGIEDRIKYLIKASEDGKKSAIKRKEKYGSAVPFNAPYNSICNTNQEIEGSLKSIEGRSKLPSTEIEPNPNPNPNPNKDIVLSKDNTRPIAQQLDTAPKVPYEDFLNTWNNNCQPLAKVSKLTPIRKLKIKHRFQDNSDLTYWTGLIKKMASSEFCRNGKWANFDWLIKNDTNYVKLSEGNYDNARDKPSDINWDNVFGPNWKEKKNAT